MKFLNFDSTTSKEKRKIQLQELEEMRLNAYKLFKLYTERTKRYHEKRSPIENSGPDNKYCSTAQD